MTEAPQNVKTVLELLRKAGYQAFLVGGCVRDMLRGCEPHDWDITTSATPDEMKKVFSGLRIAPNGSGGEKHGTVTVVIDHEPIEVTTFRLDGEYSDGRRPDSVGFSRNLSDDLCRRDFTINAICIDEQGGIIDLFDGKGDLKRRVIRAIGDPDKRFCEDALRILRALRFAAAFGFEIEPETRKSIFKNIPRLDLLARERVADELLKLICAPDCLRILLQYSEVICRVLPELAPAVGMHQRQDYHCYDVYGHIMHSVAAAPADGTLRLAMLLHDIGKPSCADGEGHFHRHEQAGVDMAKDILKRLNCGKARRERVLFLIERHSLPLYPADRLRIRKLMAKYGEQAVDDLFEVQLADVKAQRPEIAQSRIAELEKARKLFEEERSLKPALTIKQLKIGGRDLIELGMTPSPQMGRLLSEMLRLVIEEKLPNERQPLLEYAKSRI